MELNKKTIEEIKNNLDTYKKVNVYLEGPVSSDPSVPDQTDNYLKITGYVMDDQSGDVLVYFDPSPTLVIIS